MRHLAKKIGVILGTRPEIIKMSPVIKELLLRRVDLFILHTGQHYSYNLDGIFFKQLEIPNPKFNLHSGSGTHAEETAKMLVGIEKILVEEQPDAVLVEGDTNTVLAGALAAAKLQIQIGHIEAGLRSHDMTMPEEINRVIVDHISDYLFAPTKISRSNLIQEGISPHKVTITGNTIVDALEDITARSSADFKVRRVTRYVVLTLHRQENTEDPSRLRSIMKGVERFSDETRLPVYFLVHPRTKKKLHAMRLATGGLVRMENPVGYVEFINMLKNATLVFTDSGGVQEEACILRVPCVTLRWNTERPETVEIGANAVAGTSANSILNSAQMMIRKEKNWMNPFGDGHAAQRIASIVLHRAWK